MLFKFWFAVVCLQPLCQAILVCSGIPNSIQSPGQAILVCSGIPNSIQSPGQVILVCSGMPNSIQSPGQVITKVRFKAKKFKGKYETKMGIFHRGG